MLVKKIMKLFKNYFEGNKLNANEIALLNENGKYKTLDKYLNEKIGGQLIAFGMVVNNNSNDTKVAKDEVFSFSDVRIKGKKSDITNYVDGILEFTGGTFLVHTKNIVGFVEAQVYISGYGDSGTQGFWWAENDNPLPEGVTIPYINGINFLSTGPVGANYGGSSNTYFYKVDENVGDVKFYVNPTLKPYNGSFTPAKGGTKCYLLVKVYAKN